MRNVGYFFLVSIACSECANAQTVEETVQIAGRPVNIQKLTLVCNGQFENKRELHTATRKFTLHLIDRNAFAAAGGTETRPEGFGFYDWSASAWRDFVDDDENTFWLYGPFNIVLDSEDELVRAPTLFKDGGYYQYGYEVYISGLRFGISRSTLALTLKWNRISCSSTGSSGKGCDSVNKNRYAPEKTYPCQLTKYERPPERLGY